MQRSVCSMEDVRTTDCCDVACWEQQERVIDGGADLQNITGLQNLLNHQTSVTSVFLERVLLCLL